MKAYRKDNCIDLCFMRCDCRDDYRNLDNKCHHGNSLQNTLHCLLCKKCIKDTVKILIIILFLSL